MNENILNGDYRRPFEDDPAPERAAIDALRDLLARGQQDGVFRRDVDPIELHMSISALCIFNIANRATFSTIFKRDMASPRALAARRAEVVDIILRYVNSKAAADPRRFPGQFR